MPNSHPPLPEATTDPAPFRLHSFDTMERPPRWSHEDPSRLLNRLRDLDEAEQAQDSRAILFVGNPTSSPTRIWVIPAAR
jgi:hypothetical protein